MSITREESVKRALEFLCQKFPACFVKRPEKRRPLTNDIHCDIDARFEASRERDFVHKAIRAYRNNYYYQRALRVGAERIDLDGRQVGVVTEEEAERAGEEIVRLTTAQERANSEVMRQEKPNKRWEKTRKREEERRLSKEAQRARLRALEARNRDDGPF